MEERIELFQKARKLGIIGALLGLALESGFLPLIFLAIFQGWSLLREREVDFNNPATILYLICFGSAMIIYLLILYFSLRNIGKVFERYSFSTYFGASALTLFLPFVSYLLRGKSLKALGKALQNNFFLISSYLYFIATPLALFSIVQFDIRPLNIVFKIIPTLAYALALFGLAFILLGFLYFPESPKPADSVDNI
jgi:hypothetical protein